MKVSRKRLEFLGLVLAVCGVTAFFGWYGGRHQPAARLQVIGVTPTNQGQIVHFRLIPAHRGQFLANIAFAVACDKQSVVQRSFRLEGDSRLNGFHKGPQDFDMFFVDDYPVWRLQVEVQPQAALFERLKWDIRFTFERLRGFGWLPTPPQFFGLLDTYRSFVPGRAEVVTSEAIAVPGHGAAR